MIEIDVAITVSQLQALIKETLLRPGGFKGGYATTYCGCLAAPIGVLCLVVYRVDLLRRSV